MSCEDWDILETLSEAHRKRLKIEKIVDALEVVVKEYLDLVEYAGEEDPVITNLLVSLEVITNKGE